MAEKEHESHGGGHGDPSGGHGGGGHEEAHEGAPEWIISFADNTALMMGFFVIMLAFSMTPKGNPESAKNSSSEAAKASGQTTEQLDWALAVRDAFNNPVSVDSTDPKDRILVMRKRERMRTPSEDPGLRGEKTQVQSIRPTDYHNFYGSISFAAHSSELGAEAPADLDQVAAKLRGVRLVVEIRGHASAEEAFGASDHGMLLSFQRAEAVARALSERGMLWKQFRLVPCGDNDRIKPLAYNAPEHAQNTTVEVVVTDEAMQE